MITRRQLVAGAVAGRLTAASSFDPVFEYVRSSTKHGGLLIERGGRLLYERYFGSATADSTPNLASVGKSFTSIAAGILVAKERSLFRVGLDTRPFVERLMPGEVFPLGDKRKSEIRLGQLLAMTSGIRGNSPGFVHGKPVPVEPPGLDGWQAMVDENAVKADLWCPPGSGYSYATAGVHLVSMMIRHVTGVELQDYLAEKLAKPLGWKSLSFGYARPEMRHTPGGGGIQLLAADVVRFGRMLLRKGEGIVPASYVALCGKASPYNPHFPYSLQFDVNTDRHVAAAPADSFWKSGSGGHCLYVVPSLDLVVWKLGGRDDQYGLRSGSPFRPAVDAQTAVVRTLEMVVEAVRTTSG